MRTFVRFYAVGLCLLSLSACAEDEATDVVSDDVTYADVEPILEANCTSCHSEPLADGVPFAFDGYQAAADRSDKIVKRAVDGDPGPMPPSGLALSDADEATVKAWAEAGAPE